MLAKLFKQGMHYASGTLLLSVASLVSFPILTRFLPVDQYGMLSLLTTLSGLCVAVYKFGLQQSVVRYFRHDDNDFYSSILFSFLLSVFLVSIFLCTAYIFIEIDIRPEYFYLILLVSIFQSIRSIVMSNYAANEQSLFVNAINVSYKYGSLLLMLLFIFYYEKSAFSVLLSLLIVDAMFAALIFLKWTSSFNVVKPKITTVRTLFLYGSPLMLAELIQMAHAFIDRFLIEYYFDLERVAAYVAPYSMSKIISDIIFGGLAVAIVPIYMGLWNRKEYEQTSQLLSKTSDYFLLIFPIAVGGLYLISDSLISIAASDKYSETAYIMPIVFLGVGMFASTFIYSAGLRIKKNQSKILQYVTESLILNVVLNILFLEEYGIHVSAWATVCSYFWMSLRYFFASRTIINISFNWNSLLLGSFIALVLVVIESAIFVFDIQLLNLIIRLLIGGAISVVMLFIFSKEVNHDMRMMYSLFINKMFKNKAT